MKLFKKIITSTKILLTKTFFHTKFFCKKLFYPTKILFAKLFYPNMNLFKKIIYPTILIAIIIALILNPKENMTVFLSGLNVWATKVIPALFPFFFFTKLLSGTNFLNLFGQALCPITTKLYNCGGMSSYIYAMSIISGYPVGAKLTSDFYLENKLSQNECIRITSFASTSGPLFIIGTVGIGMFHSNKIGIIILVSHIIGAIFNGLIYRRYGESKLNAPKLLSFNNSKDFFTDSIISSIKSILVIGGYISIFFVLIGIINRYNIFFFPINLIGNIFNVNINIISALLNGIFEVTLGCINLSALTITNNLKCILSTFLISFGGLCVHLQAFTYLNSFKMKYSLFLTQKTTQAILSTILAILITLIVKI